MACSYNRLKVALLEEVKNITDITREANEESKAYALNRIPEGDTKAQNANLDTVIYRSARQAPTGYKLKNQDPRALIAGTMVARGEDNTTTIFDTQINNIDENNCAGSCLIDFAQGYRRTPGYKYELSLTTPEFCARDFDRFDAVDFNYWFKEQRNQFTRYGRENYEENLLNLAIQLGEANTSILGPDQFNVTSGGWQAPPAYFLSIFHLREWRKRIMHNRRNRGLATPDGWKLEIEVPMEDWFNAVMLDQTKNYAWLTPGGDPLARVALEPLTDPQDGIRTRQYHDYAGIRAYFTDYPVKGYFRRIAASGNEFQFVRVFHYINVEGGEAGVYQDINQDYFGDHITVDGVDYDLVIAIPHIDRDSFERFPLAKPHKPGSASLDYDVRVIDGARIPCNDFDDKWKLVARHGFGIKNLYPELTGFLVYKAGLTAGYVNILPRRENAAGPQDFAIPQAYANCDPDPCAIANCAACGQVPNENLQCVASGSLPVEVLNLVPGGAVNTIYEGAPYTLRLAITRTNDLSAATVAYATAAGSATAGTHYTTTSGTATFAAGEKVKYVDVPILTNTTGSNKTFTVTLSSPTGATLGQAVATVSIVDGVS